MFCYQNLTMEEAARVLGISRPAFCRRLQKARTLLRRELEGRETDEGYAHSETS